VTHTVRWTAKKIAQRLALIEPLVYRRCHALSSFQYQPLTSPLEPPPTDSTADDSSWTTIEPNSYWGHWNTCFVLRVRFSIPARWEETAPVALFLPLGEAGDFSHPEALAYIDGEPYAACDRNHQEILLSEKWRDGQEHLLALHGWTGLGGGGWHARDEPTQLFLRPCAVVQIDQPTRDFVATARVALGVATTLSDQITAKNHLLNGLDDAFRILDTREPFGESFYASIPEAHAALRAGIERAGAPLDVDITATGHAHIDVAWLWTLGQTRRKAGRTFHTVIRLMEQFPEYHFTQSQPQLYEFIRQDYPELFAQIKRRVAEGRWELTGDMWIEADCNLSGAESLARQFLIGRTFFREHFGYGTSAPVLWLPDVFGYAWALPQLIKQAGLEYFFTIKIGWSQYNRLPYDSFWWQGLDGTRVLTHFSPTPEKGSAYASTYNAMATAEDVLDTWTNYRQKDLSGSGDIPPLLMAFGFGDGGGGPTHEMLENLREMKSFPATPRVRQGAVGDFFRILEETAGDRLPTWNGELYLEYHRGTYTTQSRNKRANRTSEFLLHDAELLATLATLSDPNYRYPANDFTIAWRLICLNQFHDIIPGSSIHDVYVESQQQYTQIRQIGNNVCTTALESIAQHREGDLLVINPTSFRHTGLARWEGKLAADQHLRTTAGAPILAQQTAEGTLMFGEWDGLSTTGIVRAEGATPAFQSELQVSPTRLENPGLLVELNPAGDITRIYDKRCQRELLPPGAVANQFQAFEDRPMNWDAWDIDIFYTDTMWTAEPTDSVTVVEQGPLRATLRIQRRILHSTYTQQISLGHTGRQLTISTTIDWRERHTLLKVAFPVNILAPQATYEIQWGNVQRPTHRNTSWDWARFETCAQKWVDLSEGDYGVSLLNDCKYGHDIHNNVMRISLLRSPTEPDPEADQGKHRFTYSLLPHEGTWGEETIRAAYALNDPLIVYEPPDTVARPATGMGSSSLVALDRPNLVIETVKRAEDGNGIIVRLYESQRRRGKAVLHTNFALSGAWRTNLLEEEQEELPIVDGDVQLIVKPYEIITLRLQPAASHNITS
jgi:alpha-mannosidase